MTVVMRLEDVTLEYPVPRQYRKEDVKPSGVRNISLEVKQGEVLGIIGRNGSGKSTLLKMMAGVFPPNSGTIAAKGSVSLLAGVGVGFHKELTGRENAYLYGALMGRTTEQIDDLIEEIQAFAELKHHFDRPIRTYSSGMKSRLGISVATAFKPDLLLIDEVLGVGDASFRKKSEERIQDMIAKSGTVVMVSHSMKLLQNICTHMILIEDGSVIFSGTPKETIEKYSTLF
jgi:ABC-type polysaccharide/polyol phosphate transport system ATPase subunit